MNYSYFLNLCRSLFTSSIFGANDTHMTLKSEEKINCGWWVRKVGLWETVDKSFYLKGTEKRQKEEDILGWIQPECYWFICKCVYCNQFQMSDQRKVNLPPHTQLPPLLSPLIHSLTPSSCKHKHIRLSAGLGSVNSCRMDTDGVMHLLTPAHTHRQGTGKEWKMETRRLTFWRKHYKYCVRIHQMC